MPKRSSKKQPRDLNRLAASIVDEATSEETPQEEPQETSSEETVDGKDPNAVALGRKGGIKGGPARAKKLTPERRKEIARQAAETRWRRAREQA